jgi:hypothetical protein
MPNNTVALLAFLTLHVVLRSRQTQGSLRVHLKRDVPITATAIRNGSDMLPLFSHHRTQPRVQVTIAGCLRAKAPQSC